MTSPPDARRSLSRRPVGPVSTAGMEAVARMASFTKREESDLPACITAEISDSAECKVSWWSSYCKVGIGLWRFWGVNKLGAIFVGGRVSQRSVVIREFDKEVGEREVGESGAEVSGWQIDNLEYSVLSLWCNCATLPTESCSANEREFLFSPIFPQLRQRAAVSGGQMHLQ